LNTGEGEGLLAHELTHVAQRARFGPNLPPEDSDEGRALEAEAVAAEMVYAPSTAMRSLPIQPANAPQLGEPTAAPPLPLAAPSAGLDEDALAASIFERLSGFTTASPGGQMPSMMSPAMAPSAPAAPAVSGIQRADDPPAAPAATTATTEPATGTPANAATTGHFATRPSDEELHNLSSWLYPEISHYIKRELREGRERLGMITDHYRKW
jgi:hypothetical protein